MITCLALALGLTVSACGGGGANTPSSTTATQEQSTLVSPQSVSTSDGTQAVSMKSASVDSKPASRNEASRFLMQATFGPTEADIDHLMAVGYDAWFKEQFSAPMNTVSHLSFWDQAEASLVNGFNMAGGGPVNSFWREALSGPDQLRQRVAFALSEIFVISNLDACGDNQSSRGVSAYMDMLGEKAFGNFRQLLEKVALNPIMGCYLSHIHNLKEDPATGREPDQNFAREVMQLFSIGLYELNKDASLKLGPTGAPIETYGPQDIFGMAKVFTGWSWNCGDTSDSCFFRGFINDSPKPDRWVRDMQPFARFHSPAAKSILGKTLAAQSTPDPAASLKFALDTLAAHPNVGPFIGRQLIQRFVTSNPSPAYVARVSAAFDASGGNMATTVRAVLMDPEARDTSAAYASPTFGKPKEPILKLSQLLRAYGATSTTGGYIVGYTEDPAYGLSQSPMRAGSVFNFFRPGYVLPGSQSAQLGLQTPEFQLMNETSVAGYVNFMRDVVWWGLGWQGYDKKAALPDVLMAYQRDPASAFLTLADQPSALVDDVDRRLMHGAMSAELKADILNVVSKLDFRSATNPTPQQILDTRQHRVWTALLLTVASPQYQVQR